jgi:hypothetical protein
MNGLVEEMKGDVDIIAQNPLLLESEQIRFPYQQKKSMQSPDGLISSPLQTSTRREGEGGEEPRRTAPTSTRCCRGREADRLPGCGRRRRCQRLGGSRPGLVLGLMNSTIWALRCAGLDISPYRPKFQKSRNRSSLCTLTLIIGVSKKTL